MIPGAFLGLGCSLLAQHPSTDSGNRLRSGRSGAGTVYRMEFRPFNADESLSYFLKNVSSLKPITLMMIGVGALIAYWIGGDAGFSRISPRGAYRQAPSSEPRKSDVNLA